ncbi:nicotinate phosphoribosyltransferase [Chromobacterium sphagni]|uniref:Nicotinate phosphoribosyltransferase n=1 Tax=Chromobacterium sphagni TaxID=1903179 RepID=A0A1S1X1B1_9NEIS|nr:nicotinate phosphoribosyltransferase [Chromobacterium sphagni]OHX13209.1 nicotinate phosphoribosyltransferase [Chromobacterium sphagni]OHX20995.1 nicotinate phosphoribosyltransferase [Chromobacterium sphagni]
MPHTPPLIHSLLDTDLYKFTMLQVVLHQFPAAHGEYEFKCRNHPDTPLTQLKQQLEAQLDHLCRLRFSQDELDYLRGLRFIKSDFVDYLELFHLQRRFIDVTEEGDQLAIRIKGPMVQAMFFEIFVLSIVNELYFRPLDTVEVRSEGVRRLEDKIATLQRFRAEEAAGQRFPLLIADFGTRRRFSRDWQEHVVERLNGTLPEIFRGTSNVHLARKLGITPIGTMAHEFFQAFQALGVRLRDFQTAALESWVQEYRGDLGIALTDVVGMDAFLADFDLYFAKLFDGLRHDSGDPYVWGEKAIAHYRKLRIDPASKMLTFSDGLSVDRALQLHRHFSPHIQVSFGIGTHFTNDMGLEPLQIVLKLVSCNGQPVAKLSDSPGKTMCSDETFLAYLRQVFRISSPR